jgi:hypothetical protein
MTTLVQLADIVAYVISWGLRLRRMTAPAREELSDLAKQVRDLGYVRHTEAGDPVYGLTIINDLRPVPRP